MVAYSFQKQFAEPILACTKRHTIRADRKRHARPGEELQLYTGMRTVYCRLLARAECSSVLPITLDLRPAIDGGYYVLDGITQFGEAALDQFARSDGFGSWSAMLAFWAKHHPGVPVFNGWMVSWGALRDA